MVSELGAERSEEGPPFPSRRTEVTAEQKSTTLFLELLHRLEDDHEEAKAPVVRSPAWGKLGDDF
jgi:hypothetical protein